MDNRTANNLEEYFDDLNSIHGYFNDFKSVSESVFSVPAKATARHIPTSSNVQASHSRLKPHKGINSGSKVISNCKDLLEEQIKTNKPKIIVCNGAEVSKFMLEFLPPPSGHKKEQTSYLSNINGVNV